MDGERADEPSASGDRGAADPHDTDLGGAELGDIPAFEDEDEEDEPGRGAGEQTWRAWREALFGPEMADRFGSARDRFAADAPSVLRSVVARAAELTAMAARSAGPLAHRVAEVTDVAGAKVAVASDHLAADLRAHDAESADTDRSASAGATAKNPGSAKPEAPEAPEKPEKSEAPEAPEAPER